MEIPLVQIQWAGNRIVSLPADYILDVIPLPEWPNGRKGQLLAGLWAQLRDLGRQGLVLMDPDMAADPDDWSAMAQAVEADPGSVLTCMAKAWPASTSRPDWYWSHRGGRLGYPTVSQDETVPIVYVSTCMVWLPGRLLDLAEAQLPGWRWDEVDVGLSEVALRHDIPLKAVYACRPKHLHF